MAEASEASDAAPSVHNLLRTLRGQGKPNEPRVPPAPTAAAAHDRPSRGNQHGALGNAERAENNHAQARGPSARAFAPKDPFGDADARYVSLASRSPPRLIELAMHAAHDAPDEWRAQLRHRTALGAASLSHINPAGAHAAVASALGVPSHRHVTLSELLREFARRVNVYFENPTLVETEEQTLKFILRLSCVLTGTGASTHMPAALRTFSATACDQALAIGNFEQNARAVRAAVEIMARLPSLHVSISATENAGVFARMRTVATTVPSANLVPLFDKSAAKMSDLLLAAYNRVYITYAGKRASKMPSELFVMFTDQQEFCVSAFATAVASLAKQDRSDAPKKSAANAATASSTRSAATRKSNGRGQAAVEHRPSRSTSSGCKELLAVNEKLIPRLLMRQESRSASFGPLRKHVFHVQALLSLLRKQVHDSVMHALIDFLTHYDAMSQKPQLTDRVFHLYEYSEPSQRPPGWLTALRGGDESSTPSVNEAMLMHYLANTRRRR